MAYQLYRNTTLGNSLQESLDELIQTQQITPQLALQVLLQFDKAINTALANRVRNRVNFKGSLNTYRFCDNVWTFVLNDVEFREVTDLVKVDKVKIVACDGKSRLFFFSLSLRPFSLHLQTDSVRTRSHTSLSKYKTKSMTISHTVV
uniref:Transcription initiation factor IIA subunit 2 n=1 Tax=Oncorhynchus tshawytscha TaxID=74940 RepID=A0AAZ3RDG3_ONCTS